MELHSKGMKSRTVRYLSAVFDVSPTQRACMAQGIFWWVCAQGRSTHAPGIPKMPTAPSAFPLIGEPSDEPNPPEGGKSLGGRPPEAEENLQVPGHTRLDPSRR